MSNKVNNLVTKISHIVVKLQRAYGGYLGIQRR